jgi:integrase
MADNKEQTTDKSAKAWAHNGFEKTSIPYLYRRNGKRGQVYYGRIRRGGKLYMKKLAMEFELAKRALRKWVGDAETQAAQEEAYPDRRGLTTWGDFRDNYLRGVDLDITMSPKSKTYQHESAARIVKVWNIAFLKCDLETRRVGHFTQEHWQIWAHHAAAFHTTTYNNMRGTLFRIFQVAIDHGAILANPARRVKRLGKGLPKLGGCVMGEPGEPLTKEEEKDLAFPDNPDEQRWYPEPEQLQAIVAKMRNYKFGRTHRAADFTELLAYTGCRLSEACRLRWGDVDWGENQLRINGAKGRMVSSESSIRFVPLFPALAELLKRLEKERTDQNPSSPVALVKESRGTMGRACVALNLPRKLDHHDLRHYFASRAVNAGRPIPIVADWLGHKDGGALLLRVYRHRNQKLSQEWAKDLPL